MRNSLVITLLALLVPVFSGGQDIQKADKFFSVGNFEEAGQIYQDLLEKSYDRQVAYKLAVCYLNTNFDKTRAIPLLEKLVKDPEADPNAGYLLGRALHYNGEYLEAIRAFNAFFNLGKGLPENISDAGKQVEYCENAFERSKFPLSVEIKNLGQQVNSSFSDYYPFVPEDESFIVFNSKRNDGSGFKQDGSFHSNIYISRVVDGQFTKSVPLEGDINQPDISEEIVGMNQSGTQMIVYVDDERQKSELRLVTLADGKVKSSEKLPKRINSRYHEIAASINDDGTVIYFASDKPGGYGGIDIYVIRKLPNGKWGKAQNLGPAVNTKYDEDFPNIGPDGKTLYFSSKGHASMGGYDIFVAEWDPEKLRFVRSRNLGAPINTPGDDMNFRLSHNGRYGYISYAAGQGLGDFDIYRVTFLEAEPEITVITGKLVLPERFEWTSVSMYIENAEGETVGEYLPNLNTFRYVIALAPGSYTLHVDIEGLTPYEEKINVLDKSSFEPMIEKDIVLK